MITASMMVKIEKQYYWLKGKKKTIMLHVQYKLKRIQLHVRNAFRYISPLVQIQFLDIFAPVYT